MRVLRASNIIKSFWMEDASDSSMAALSLIILSRTKLLAIYMTKNRMKYIKTYVWMMRV